jgi:uncharacterized protein YxeA
MKKILFILLALILAWSGSAFAAAASCTTTDYGYYITGGNSTTLVPQDTWKPNTYYPIGSKVSTAGTIYTNQFASTSSTAFIYDYNNNMWTKKGNATIWVYSASFSPAAATDTAIFTSLGATDNTAMMPAFTLTANLEQIKFDKPGQNGIPLRNLTVTMSQATDVVYLYVYEDNFTSN